MSKEQLSTSKKEVPKHKNALEEKYKEQQVESVEETKRVDETNVSDIKNELPQPTGWRILVLPFKMNEKTKGGVIMNESTLERQQVASQCGNVIAMGPQCYKDNERYPEGPWCKVGDWVVFARYAGSRINIEGGEVRLLNEDEILATVKDPEDLLHKY